jgi:hypothetical protein
MNQAMFDQLPPLLAQINPFFPHNNLQNQQRDVLYSTSVQGGNNNLYYQINEASYLGIDTPIQPGTRILIREAIYNNLRHRYMLIANDATPSQHPFRRVVYIYGLDEVGPEYDLTTLDYIRLTDPQRAAVIDSISVAGANSSSSQFRAAVASASAF